MSAIRNRPGIWQDNPGICPYIRAGKVGPNIIIRTATNVTITKVVSKVLHKQAGVVFEA